MEMLRVEDKESASRSISSLLHDSPHYQRWTVQSLAGENDRMWKSLNDLVAEYKKENEGIPKFNKPTEDDSVLKATSLVIPNGKAFVQRKPCPCSNSLGQQKPCKSETPQYGPHKVILVGDSGVGKSSFMLRLCDDCFNDKMNPSFGLDFKTKTISLNGTDENVQIWDTAGQERFRSITQSYFRKVDGIILVYDITHEESFLNLQNWVTCIQESGQLSAPMSIVGNKLDLEHLRCVSKEMAKELADFYEADFIEVSAKDGRNINQVGLNLVRKLVERRKAISPGNKSYTINPSQATEQTELSCCVIL